MRRYQAMGFLGFLLVLGSAATWAAMSTIHGAVIAPGVTVVETYTKKVQHRDGGIVREIAVAQGDLVTAGQPLLRLDDIEDRAELAVIEAALLEWLAKRARLEAERDSTVEVEFPAELSQRRTEPAIAHIVAGQAKLFESQRAGRNGRLQQLEERIGQYGQEIHGLSAQIASKAKQIDFIEDELAGQRKLQKQGLTQIGKVLALEREAARLEGERGQLTADVARSNGHIAETKLQVIQIQDDYRTKTLAELREVEAQIRELEERRIAIRAKLSRTTMVAPIGGYVHQLAVHTVGGVIAPGETVMLIVPEKDRLIIEAQVRPQDIDEVHVDQLAIMHFPGIERRLTPQIQGRVMQIAADLTAPLQPNALPYYSVRLTVDHSEVTKLGIEKLRPGMPAEALIRTRERTPLSYLIQPLMDQVWRAFRER